MTMKQTQTKLFDFSDAGLDFSSASKDLFPDRFKKMLAEGYNVQTVSSVSIAGNQVTLTYGGAHGYVADRVLKVDSGALASLNSGEFYIDSVTTNTVTLTIDAAPGSVSSGFTTRIAPLGWSLEYESGLVQLYKMKYLDERDCYVRLVFTLSTTGYKNMVTVCTGKTANVGTGEITDAYSYAPTKNNTGIVAGFAWGFTALGVSSSAASYTHAQGLASYGKGCVVGSKYHFLIMNNGGREDYAGRVQGIIPQCTHDLEQLDYPLVLGVTITNPTSTGVILSEITQFGDNDAAMIGAMSIALGATATSAQSIDTGLNAAESFYSSEVLGQQVTAALPVVLHEKSTKQFLGYAIGLYRVNYASSSKPSYAPQNSPSVTADIDLESKIILHATFTGRGDTSHRYFAVPIEEIKIVS